MEKIVYRVKDLEGNHQDFNSIEEIAETFDFNFGTVKNGLLNKNKTLEGLKVYTVKKTTEKKQTKKTKKEDD